MSLVVIGNTTLTSAELLASRIYTITIDSALAAICIVLFCVCIAVHIGLFVITTRKSRNQFKKTVNSIHEEATKLIHLTQAQQIHSPAPDTLVKENANGNVVAHIAPYSNTPFITKQGKVLNDTSKHYSPQRHYMYVQSLVKREQEKLYWSDMQRTTRRLFYAFPYWKYFEFCCSPVTQNKPLVNTIFQSISNVILFICRVLLLFYGVGSEAYQIYLQTSGEWDTSVTINNTFRFLTNISFFVMYSYYFVVIVCTIYYAAFRVVLEIILRIKISNSIKDLKTRLPTGKSLQHDSNTTFLNEDVLTFLYQPSNKAKQSLYSLARYMDYIGQTNGFCRYFSKIQIADRICDIFCHVPLIWGCLALTTQFLVGFAFWCILIPTSGTLGTPSYLTFAKHGIPVVLMAVDFFISNYHFPLWYAFACSLFGSLYMIYLTILNFLVINNIISEPFEWPYGSFFNYDVNKLAVIYHIVVIGCYAGFFIVLYYGLSWFRRGVMELGMLVRSRLQKKKERKYWMDVEVRTLEMYGMNQQNEEGQTVTKTYHEEVRYTSAPQGGIPMGGGHMYYMPQTTTPSAQVIGTYTSPRGEHQRRYSEVSEVATYTDKSDED